MTPEERDKKLDELHTALCRVPPGSPAGAKTLLQKINTVVNAYERGSWFARLVIWGLPTTAGLGAAAQMIMTWFKK